MSVSYKCIPDVPMAKILENLEELEFEVTEEASNGVTLKCIHTDYEMWFYTGEFSGDMIFTRYGSNVANPFMDSLREVFKVQIVDEFSNRFWEKGKSKCQT